MEVTKYVTLAWLKTEMSLQELLRIWLQVQTVAWFSFNAFTKHFFRLHLLQNYWITKVIISRLMSMHLESFYGKYLAKKYHFFAMISLRSNREYCLVKDRSYLPSE